jgi:acyl dehydratase
MPIDTATALNARPVVGTASWSPDDVILYNLGVGAAELTYAYERELKVLPTFGAIPASGFLPWLEAFPGLDIDMRSVLHGEHVLELHGPLPVAAEVENRARVAAIHDKGKAAVVVIEVETSERGGRSLCTNRASLFVRGEGGFGGDAGPRASRQVLPRDPDLVVESPTLPHQALLYRLSGDKNPVHADPEAAREAGFETPILHGLCTFGVACKAVVDGLLGGDTCAVRRFSGRFADVVLPGETIATSMWKQDGGVAIECTTRERSTPVLTHAQIELDARRKT